MDALCNSHIFHGDWIVLDEVTLNDLLQIIGGALRAGEAAAGVDGRLRELGADAARLVSERDAAWLLRRHRHRSEHLDEIEGALGLRGCCQP